MKSEKGISLVETLVSMVVMLFIMIGVFGLIITFGDSSKTENAKVKVNQEQRFITNVLADEIKNAGSVFTILNNSRFLGAEPAFNGICPLTYKEGSTPMPDGIVLATGDQHTVDELAEEFKTSGSKELKMTQVSDNWQTNDRGILISDQGYYVFRVTLDSNPDDGDDGDGGKEDPPADNTLTITPCYTSGTLQVTLANGGYYQDTLGTVDSFPAGTQVIRLSAFSIYVFNQIYDERQQRDVRQLLRIVDILGDGKITDLSGDTQAIIHIISENIWDLQISYAAYQNYPQDLKDVQYFFSKQTNNSNDLSLLMDALRIKTVKEVNLTFVLLTDEYAGKRNFDLQVPAIEDQPEYSIPKQAGDFTYRLLAMKLHPRNYNTTI